jgi:hypothetical protein
VKRHEVSPSKRRLVRVPVFRRHSASEHDVSDTKSETSGVLYVETTAYIPTRKEKRGRRELGQDGEDGLEGRE